MKRKTSNNLVRTLRVARFNISRIIKPNIKAGKSSFIGSYSIVRSRLGSLIIGDNTSILKHARIQCLKSKASIEIGSNSFAAYHLTILCGERIVIGNNCLIASYVFISDTNHSVDFKQSFDDLVTKPVAIGDFCWVGEKSIILPGVSLGNHVIVGAGSVVTKSFPDYSMIAGNPARLIKTYDLSIGEWVKVK